MRNQLFEKLFANLVRVSAQYGINGATPLAHTRPLTLALLAPLAKPAPHWPRWPHLALPWNPLPNPHVPTLAPGPLAPAPLAAVAVAAGVWGGRV